MRNEFLLICLLVSTGVAQAADGSLSTQSIVEEQREIRTQIEAVSGRYAEMPAIKRQKILAEQNKVLALLEGKTSTDELSPVQRTAVFNDLEAISAAINNKEDERIVCTREKMTGSNRITRVCKSIAQINFDRENSRKAIREANQGACNSPACKPSL